MLLTTRGKRRLLIVFGAVVVIALTFVIFNAVRAAHKTKLIAESRQSGTRAYERGDYEEALDKLGYVLSHEKNDPEALLAFADSRRRVPEPNDRHIPKAVAYYNAALRLDPQNLDALSALLDLYRRMGYRTEAVETADRVLALSQNHIDALSIKAEIAFIDEDYPDSSEFYVQLAELQPQELQWRRGLIQAMEAQEAPQQQIIALCDEWIEKHEEDGRFRLLKANVSVMGNDVPAAISELRTAALLGADSPEILTEMMQTLTLFGLDSEAADLLALVRKRHPMEPWVYVSAVQHYWRAGRLGDALTEVEDARGTLNREDPGLLRWKALLHVVMNKPDAADEALQALESAATDAAGESNERDLNAAWGQALRARLNMTGAAWRETITAYAGAIARLPRTLLLGRAEHAVLRFFLAEAYQQIGEDDLALRALEEAERLDHTWAAIPVARAESLLSLGRAPAAFEVLSRVIRQRPNASLREYVLLARAWLELGDVGQYLRLNDLRTGNRFALTGLLEELRVFWPDNPEVVSLLAEAHARTGAGEDAAAIIEEALVDDATETRLLIQLATVSARHALDYEFELLLRARDQAGLTGEVANATASFLCLKGRCDEGLAILDEFVSAAEDQSLAEASTRQTRIQLLLQTNRGQALAAMRRWLDDEPDSLSSASFILMRDQAWDDADLIDAALTALERCLGSDAPRVMLARATQLYRFERDDPASISRALSLVDQVIRRTPESKQALTLNATLLLSGGEPQTDKAIQALQRAIVAYPGHLDLYPRLIMLLQRQGDYDTAESYLAQLASYRANDRALRQMEIQFLEAQGSFGQAITRLSEFVDEHSPEDEQVKLASLYRKIGDFDEAERIYRRLIHAPSCSSHTLTEAAGFYASTGRFDRGLEILQGGGSAEENHDRGILLARYCREHDRFEEASAYLAEAQAQGSSTAPLWLESAYLHMAGNDLAKARDDLVRALELDPDNDEARTNLAVVSLSLGDNDREQAMAFLREAETADPALAATLALFERLAGRADSEPLTDQDLAAAAALVEDYPQYFPAWRIAITMHARAGQQEEAIRLAHRAMARLPAHAAPARMAAELLIQTDRYEEALDAARIWRHRSRENPLEADVMLASLETDRGHADRALRHLNPHANLIIEERERDPGRFMLYIHSLLATGRADRALEIMEPLLGGEADLRSLFVHLAPTLDKEIGLRVLTTAEPYSLQDSSAAALEIAGVWTAHARRFDVQSAYDHAAELLDDIGDDGDLRLPIVLLRGSIAAGRGDLSAAEQSYRAALAHDADNVAALNNLADVLVRAGTRCGNAVHLASRALQLAPGEPSIVDTLAQALICAGRSEEGEKRLREAIAVAPRNPNLLITLAQALHIQGRTDEAKAELASASRIVAAIANPDPSVIHRIEHLTQALSESKASDLSGAEAGGKYVAGSE